MREMVLPKLQKEQYAEIKERFGSKQIVGFSDAEQARLGDVLALLERKGYIRNMGIANTNAYRRIGNFEDFEEWYKNMELEANEKSRLELAAMATINANSKEYDVFISHANRDKSDYVDELYSALRKLGIRIFYDSEVLSWGDAWKQVILDGTERSEFAIIVISENFFGREWTERELEEFLKRQNTSGQKIVLPLLHNISLDMLKAKYPFLGDIQVIDTQRYSKEDITILFAKELIKRLR